MEDAGFIIGSWVITAASIIAYAVFVIRRGKHLAENATREEMPWT
jgi:hypothetical protein